MSIYDQSICMMFIACENMIICHTNGETSMIYNLLSYFKNLNC